MRDLAAVDTGALALAAPWPRREYLASIGVGDRVQIIGGDLFGGLRAQADVYVLKWILHDWSDAACRDTLQRVRATMSSGSRIVCIDQHLDRDRPSPISSMVDLHT
jgi:O-methyltransferase